MIVAKPWSYLQSKGELSALDREEYVRLYGERVKIAERRSEAAVQLKKAKESKKDEEIKSKQAEVDKLQQQFKQITEHIQACVKWSSECDCPYLLDCRRRCRRRRRGRQGAGV